MKIVRELQGTVPSRLEIGVGEPLPNGEIVLIIPALPLGKDRIVLERDMCECGWHHQFWKFCPDCGGRLR